MLKQSEQEISSINFNNTLNSVIIKLKRDDDMLIKLNKSLFESIVNSNINTFFNELIYNQKEVPLSKDTTILVKGKPINKELIEEMIDMEICDLLTIISFVEHVNINRLSKMLKYKLLKHKLQPGVRFNTFVYVKKGSTDYMTNHWFDGNSKMFKYEERVGTIIKKNENPSLNPAHIRVKFDDDFECTFDKSTLIPLVKA